jgi:hypothetical protein
LHNRVVMLGNGVNQKTAMLGSLHMVSISRWYYREMRSGTALTVPMQESCRVRLV